MTETKTITFYQCKSGGKVLCTIEKTAENVFRAVNLDTDITCEVIKIDEYKTSVSCIEHKRRGKDGKYRKSKNLLEHNMSWLLLCLKIKALLNQEKHTTNNFHRHPFKRSSKWQRLAAVFPFG